MEPLADDITAVLDEADQLYVAVQTSTGPHVTPELFARSGARIFCLTAASTLKARVARREAVVGIAARLGARAIVATGAPTVVDPAEPATSLQDAGASLAAPLGIARFVADNAPELAGAALDLLRGRLGGPVPPHRVVLAFELANVLVLDDVVADASADGSPRDPAVTVPEHVRHLLADGPCTVGWSSEDGAPLALPATWDVRGQWATVPTAALDRLDAVRGGDACVTFDEWVGYGPSGKRGVMLRGSGTSIDEGEVTRLRVDADRVVTWDGVETSSTDVAS